MNPYAAKARHLGDQIRQYAREGRWAEAWGYSRAWGDAKKQSTGNDGKASQLLAELAILGRAAAVTTLKDLLTRKGGTFGARMDEIARMMADCACLQGAALFFANPDYTDLIPLGESPRLRGEPSAAVHARSPESLPRQLMTKELLETGVRDDLLSVDDISRRYNDDCVYAGAAHHGETLGMVAYVFGRYPHAVPITYYATSVFATLFALLDEYLLPVLVRWYSTRLFTAGLVSYDEFISSLREAPYDPIELDASDPPPAHPSLVYPGLIPRTPAELSHPLLANVPLVLKTEALRLNRVLEQTFR